MKLKREISDFRFDVGRICGGDGDILIEFCRLHEKEVKDFGIQISNVICQRISSDLETHYLYKGLGLGFFYVEGSDLFDFVELYSAARGTKRKIHEFIIVAENDLIEVISLSGNYHFGKLTE